jgi:6-pyruvoyltetrahydropterin/6-carboxytetrahydropterin synthase
MYELSIKTRFSAAHRLRDYPGSCAVLHGHNWDVEVFVRGETLDEMGILIDFRRLKAKVKGVIDDIDHVDLGATEAFGAVNPTSENIARFLYERLSREINDDRRRVDRVSVNETPEARATYRETE